MFVFRVKIELLPPVFMQRKGACSLTQQQWRTLLYACIYADSAEILWRADYGMVEHRACTNQCSSTCCDFCTKDTS